MVSYVYSITSIQDECELNIEKMIEVFKTNIKDEDTAETILCRLMAYLPEAYINFDLEDCDNILRIENCQKHSSEVILIIRQNGFECERLE